MASIKDLRIRIASVGSIKQITRAMEMVATTKLRRFQDRAIASRPYAQEIAGLVGRLAAVLGEDVGDRPLFQPGTGDLRIVKMQNYQIDQSFQMLQSSIGDFGSVEFQM